MMIFDIDVSFYRHVGDERPSVIRLSKWIDGLPKYNDLVKEIRAADEDDRKRLKKRLPAITPSGIFSGRGADHLQYPSGIMALDIDGVDVDKAKKILKCMPYIAYAGRSASGGGVYAFLKISRVEAFKSHFKAISKDLASVGLPVDPICSNISSLRFYSFDEDPLINERPAIYKKTAEVAARKVIDGNNDGGDIIHRLLGKIHFHKKDITATYADWLSIGSVLASVYGERGRGYYHQISWYHPEYTANATDHQYDKCLAYAGGFGIGLLMNICKRYGVMLAGSPVPPSSPEAGRIAS